MPEQIEEIEQVRERIADRLFGQMHGQGITSPLLLADAVLDALGLERVGWRCKHGLSEGRCGPRPDEPVYRLAGLSGREDPS